MNLHRTSLRSPSLKALTLALLAAGSLAAMPGQAQSLNSSTALAAAKPASAYSSGVAYDWMYLDLQLIQQTPGFSPPVAARALGYLGLALYESVVPGMSGYQSLAGQLNELSSLPWAQPDEPLHWPTVANAALATMTRMMFSMPAPRTRRASTRWSAACRSNTRRTLTPTASRPTSATGRRPLAS